MTTLAIAWTLIVVHLQRIIALTFIPKAMPAEHFLQSNRSGNGRLGANRYAIAIYGGVTDLHGVFDPGAQIMTKTNVNLSLPAAMLKENLVGSADVFIHSWSIPYKKTLEQLYHPKVAVFENNADYWHELNQVTKRAPLGSQFGQISMSLSMSKVLTLIADYESKAQVAYDTVYLCRPDVLLRKPVALVRAAAAADIIFNTHGNAGRADFHFLMSGHNAKKFSTIYQSIPTLKTPVVHHSGWIQEFLSQHNLRTVQDGTLAGWDEEVYRKVPEAPNVHEWKASLTGRLPPHCLEDFMSHNVRDECLVDVP